jgi:hypothetical protein
MYEDKRVQGSRFKGFKVQGVQGSRGSRFKGFKVQCSRGSKGSRVQMVQAFKWFNIFLIYWVMLFCIFVVKP